VGANFGIGLIHFNKAVDYFGLAEKSFDKNNIEEGEKYDVLAKTEFETAIPPFKKVLEIEPNNFNTLKALRTIYLKLQMTPEFQEVDKVFETLKKK
jgi:hypothetical protein